MSKSLHNNSSQKIKSHEDTIDTQVLKSNMEEFFRNSKEKILKMKDNITTLQKKNKKLQTDLPGLKNKQAELSKINEELSLRLIGMKEKLLSAQKIRNNLQLELRDLKQESDNAGNEIETLKINHNYKLKLLQNDNEHIANTKENQLKCIKTKIDFQNSYQNEIFTKIEHTKEQIKKYKTLLNDLDKHDSERNQSLLKEASEMNKFLSQI
jgi:chromosome segregation ATPase